MVFQHPNPEPKEKISAETHGRRQAIKGRYFNPYSIASQNKMHREFEYGWQEENRKINPDQVTTRTKYPQLAVLILGIILAGAIYWLNNN